MDLGHPPKCIAEYFLKHAAEHGVALTPMQVLKLVYIAHGWQLGLHQRPLVNEPIQAWRYGPVIPSLYHDYKKFGGNPITAVPAMYPSVEPSESSVLDQVWDGYGKRSGLSLSSLTHEKGSPWDITVKQSGIGAVISTDLIQDYYHRLATQ